MVALYPQTHTAHILKDRSVHLLFKRDYFPLMFLTKYLLPVTSLPRSSFSFYVCRLLSYVLSSLFGSHSLLALVLPPFYWRESVPALSLSSAWFLQWAVQRASYIPRTNNRYALQLAHSEGVRGPWQIILWTPRLILAIWVFQCNTEFMGSCQVQWFFNEKIK